MPQDDTTPVPRAERLAQAMLDQLETMNQHMEAAAKRQEVIAESLEDLIDWFNVVDKTMETLTRNNSEGRKLSLADFSKAWELAAEEVFEEDDEPGEEDPLVGAERD